MLKFLFWFLLLANAGLFAYRQGYIEALMNDGRDPARVASQLNADKIKLVPPPQEAPPNSSSTMLTRPLQPQPVVAKEPVLEIARCTEIGNFDAAEAKRFEARLSALALGDRLSQHALNAAEQRHIVFIPSQGSKEAADKMAGELRELGVTDFYIIQDNPDLRWGVSLGIFRAEEAARAHLVTLTEKGVQSARIGPYTVLPNKFAFQIRELNAAARTALKKIKVDFPQQQIRSCDSA